MVGNSPKAGAVDKSTPDEHSIGAVFGLLAHQRRRAVIASLQDQSEGIALADLAEDVAARENEGPLTAIPNAEIQDIRITLHHQHLPKLVNGGVVEYDQERDRVWIDDDATLVERALSLAVDGADER